MVTLTQEQAAPVTKVEPTSVTTVSYIDTREKMVWVHPQPIEVDSEELKVRPELMEAGRPYRFVWGGVEVFALRRDESDKVEFFVIKLESWDNLSADVVAELMIWENVSDQDSRYLDGLAE